jgi:hypothetical protein
MKAANRASVAINQVLIFKNKEQPCKLIQNVCRL